MDWLNRLEKKFKNFGIKGLMLYIITLNLAVFLITLVTNNYAFIGKLYLIPELVLKGEIWRLVTYIFIPPSFSTFWILFILYFYYLMGSSLEHEWGTFKFNVYYLIGIFATTVSVFITGGIGTAFYLNLSLFLAFAYIFPNYQILLFFIIPVKVKYLAWINAAFLLYSLFTEPLLSAKAAILVAILNFLLFFGKDIFLTIKTGRKNYYRKKSYDSRLLKDYTVHRCEICGRTEKDDNEMEFRYCAECQGDHEYCMEHLSNHKHV